jgi:hypothetical protein
MISLFEPREASLVADGCVVAVGHKGVELIRRGNVTPVRRVSWAERASPGARRL